MTEITKDHLEWTFVGRLRLMLEEPPHRAFNVTQAYALFTAILCWVMQHIRINPNEAKTQNDRLAADILKKLSNQRITEWPWSILAESERIAHIGSRSVRVPGPIGFTHHTAARFLINLRDATAHVDARNVEPFNEDSNDGLLSGFTFFCSQKARGETVWQGTITLLDEDMRRIGCNLAKIYCDALRHSEAHRQDSNFGRDAISIQETAA
jgi:hypothetical protein